MNTDKKEPLYKAASQQIVGSAMEVLNEIGHGFHQWLKTIRQQIAAGNS